MEAKLVMKPIAVAALLWSLLAGSALAGQVPNPADVSSPLTTGHAVVATGPQSIGDSGSVPGTVSSVAVSVPSILSVSGSPITSAGTIAISLATESANTSLAGPASGSAAIPTFRALVGGDLPNPASAAKGGTFSYAAVSHQWLTSISTAGAPASSQPAFTDISGTLAAAQCPTPGASTLGCVESLASASHQWLNAISTLGVPSASQPGFSDLSGAATSAQIATALTTPGPIGGTTPAAGAFTTLNASGATTLQGSATIGAASANNFSIFGNTTGNAPGFNAVGSDTNISIQFNPKGSGANVLGGTFTNIVGGGNLGSGSFNYFGWFGAATGSAPGLFAEGGDANINADIFPKGTGSVVLEGPTTVVGSLSATSIPLGSSVLESWNGDTGISRTGVGQISIGNGVFANATGQLTAATLALFNGTSGFSLNLHNNDTTAAASETLGLNLNGAGRSISLSGTLSVTAAAILSGTNTGDQTITLTGNVTGSGTGSFATTIAAVPASALPNPSATTLGGIESLLSASHKWINTISTSGVPSATQPAFSDISGSITAAQCPNPSATTIGCVESAAAVAHEWISAYSTAGAPTLSQPAFSDISGSLAAAQLPAFASAFSDTAAPTAPATTLFTYQGLALAFTPAVTGTVQVTVTATGLDNSGGAVTTAGTGIKAFIKYGTGTAPANGAANTGGTSCGTPAEGTSILLAATAAATADVAMQWASTCQATLTPGTTYWFDLVAASVGTANAFGFANVKLSVVEVP